MTLPSQEEHAAPAPSTSFTTVAALLIAIVVLYLGQGIFVPLVLATLVAFALSPVVGSLRRLHLPQGAAVLLSVLLAIALVGLAGYLIATQLVSLAADLPSYQQTIAQKLRGLQQSAEGTGTLDRLANTVEELGNQVGGAGDAPGGSKTAPIPVTITNPSQFPLAGLQSVFGSLLGPLATSAIVIIFVIFLLLQREDLRDRFLKLVSRGDLRTSTKVINESASRVSRYLFIQLCVNAVYGAIFGIGLMLLGVPNAILWGLFAALFRYIPFVGTLMAASIPIALAFAVDPGWFMLTGVVAIYVGLELVITNAVEPRLYGSSTGLSPLAVLVAAMFWATLWGPIGLILSTPLTVCLVVLGRYVPQLSFLDTLLGSEPVLAVEQRFYQRLLAGNAEEAIELAETQLADTELQQFYDSVAVPALQLAEADLQQNAADIGYRRIVVETLAAVIKDLRDFVVRSHAASDEDTSTEAATTSRVLVAGGKTELDGAVAELTAHVVGRSGITAAVLPPLSVRQEGLGQIELSGVDVVVLCYLGAAPKSYVRYAARRLKRRDPRLRVLACLFNANLSDEGLEPADLNVDAVARTIAGAELQVIEWLKAPEERALEVPADEEVQLLKSLKGATRHEKWVDEFLANVARAFNIPLALTDFLDPQQTAIASTGNASSPVAAQGGAGAVAEHVIAGGKVMVIPKVSEHEAFSKHPFFLENGIEFYAGAPLLSETGKAVGTLSVIDTATREFSPADEGRLQEFAADLMKRLSVGAPADTTMNQAG